MTNFDRDISQFVVSLQALIVNLNDRAKKYTIGWIILIMRLGVFLMTHKKRQKINK